MDTRVHIPIRQSVQFNISQIGAIAFIAHICQSLTPSVLGCSSAQSIHLFLGLLSFQSHFSYSKIRGRASREIGDIRDARVLLSWIIVNLTMVKRTSSDPILLINSNDFLTSHRQNFSTFNWLYSHHIHP